MNPKRRTNTLLFVSAIAAICLLLLCGGIAIFVFFFGVSSPISLEEQPTETTSLTTEQLEQCRALFAIQPDVELEGEYYLYTPGFLDDSMECHLRAKAETIEDIFDLTMVDPSLTTTQEVAPGRHVQFTIEMIEPGLFRIEGFWFQT